VLAQALRHSPPHLTAARVRTTAAEAPKPLQTSGTLQHLTGGSALEHNQTISGSIPVAGTGVYSDCWPDTVVKKCGMVRSIRQSRFKKAVREVRLLNM
jgi:hypothetical protein